MAINLKNQLSVFATAIALATLPGVAFAVPATPTTPTPDTTNITPTTGTTTPNITPTTGTTTPSPRTSVKKRIKLTPQQMQEIQAVMTKRNSEIEAVLDSTQKTQMAEAMRSGQRFNRALGSLTLKPDQQTQVTSIKATASQKVREIMNGQSQMPSSSTAPSTSAPLNTVPSTSAPLNTAPSNSMPSQPMQH
jgi:hypothetical protein